jgi:hypothetical protein
MFCATGLPGRLCTSTAPTPEQELATLKAQAVSLKNQLDAINQRMEALEQK